MLVRTTSWLTPGLLELWQIKYHLQLTHTSYECTHNHPNIGRTHLAIFVHIVCSSLGVIVNKSSSSVFDIVGPALRLVVCHTRLLSQVIISSRLSTAPLLAFLPVCLVRSSIYRVWSFIWSYGQHPLLYPSLLPTCCLRNSLHLGKLSQLDLSRSPIGLRNRENSLSSFAFGVRYLCPSASANPVFP